MDLFDFDGGKAEKSCVTSISKNPEKTSATFRIAKLFRYLELCLALVLVSWTFTRIPFAVKISGEYFRQLSGFVASPIFVFMLCNVIIATLIVKSGRFSSQKPTGPNSETELYEEFIKNSGEGTKTQYETDPPAQAPDVIMYHDKQTICEENGHSGEVKGKLDSDSDTDAESDTDLVHPKAYRRTRSEKLHREKYEGKLQRSETEKCRKGENPYPEDELSNEEFQRTIEEFIAKQLKFRRQESLPIVLSNQIRVPVT
ncbi:hypothetical protein CJ030_MR5G013407 [Morella rubra]|uniref:DUF4408 domain-containing protein n=1 Tax=Morella rubra TaxID=262757 RepID=A0A6A1VV78_9ROSI|nr:hypothetical protein CJ030_MR5G013407 [Morella rubra]